MTRPTKNTLAGRVYLDLQNRAHRPAADVDLLAQRLANDEAVVRARVVDISRIDLDDGVDYLTDTIIAQPIRDQDIYAGIRISMDAVFPRQWSSLNSTSMWVTQSRPNHAWSHCPRSVLATRLCPFSGYPIETVLAEKTSTAIALGEANTRVRDYADIYTLTGKHTLSFSTMHAALLATAAHRNVSLTPLSQVIGDLAGQRQAVFHAFRARLGEDGVHLPSKFADVVAAVVRFADPLLSEETQARFAEALVRSLDQEELNRALKAATNLLFAESDQAPEIAARVERDPQSGDVRPCEKV